VIGEMNGVYSAWATDAAQGFDEPAIIDEQLRTLDA
jgi:hypothetical protein